MHICLHIIKIRTTNHDLFLFFLSFTVFGKAYEALVWRWGVFVSFIAFEIKCSPRPGIFFFFVYVFPKKVLTIGCMLLISVQCFFLRFKFHQVFFKHSSVCIPEYPGAKPLLHSNHLYGDMILWVQNIS